MRRQLPKEVKEKLGAMIREARLREGFSQSQLAQKLYTAVNTVAKWELGIIAPGSFSNRKGLKRVLRISVDELIRSGALDGRDSMTVKKAASKSSGKNVARKRKAET